jgi:hypothetical protein
MKDEEEKGLGENRNRDLRDKEEKGLGETEIKE